MYQAAKMMIASNGRQSAVLLDGVMIGVGVDGISLDIQSGSAKLSITGIDVERPEMKRTSSAFAPDRQGMTRAENDAGLSDFKKERGTYAARKRNLPA